MKHKGIVIGELLVNNATDSNFNSMPNLDFKYGPYNNKDEALQLLDKKVRAIGLTIGIKTETSIIEYWFKNGIEDNDLIEKSIEIINDYSGGVNKAASAELAKQLNEDKFDKPNGNETQYINGKGELIEFPEIPEPQDLSKYQTKEDNNLTTNNKTISGAINEINDKKLYWKEF